jgi:hypothetical protein
MRNFDKDFHSLFLKLIELFRGNFEFFVRLLGNHWAYNGEILGNLLERFVTNLDQKIALGHRFFLVTPNISFILAHTIYHAILKTIAKNMIIFTNCFYQKKKTYEKFTTFMQDFRKFSVSLLILFASRIFTPLHRILPIVSIWKLN